MAEPATAFSEFGNVDFEAQLANIQSGISPDASIQLFDFTSCILSRDALGTHCHCRHPPRTAQP